MKKLGEIYLKNSERYELDKNKSCEIRADETL